MARPIRLEFLLSVWYWYTPMRKEYHHRAPNLRKGRYSERYGLYLVTKGSSNQYELSAEQRFDVASAFFYFRDQADMYLYAFVVMPDHWHALLSLRSQKSLGKLVESINRYASFRSRKQKVPMPWQREFHDHKVRQNESVVDIVRYVESNPVRKGLVGASSEWQWSSAYVDYQGRLDRSFLGYERWE